MHVFSDPCFSFHNFRGTVMNIKPCYPPKLCTFLC